MSFENATIWPNRTACRSLFCGPLPYKIFEGNDGDLCLSQISYRVLMPDRTGRLDRKGGG